MNTEVLDDPQLPPLPAGWIYGPASWGECAIHAATGNLVRAVQNHIKGDPPIMYQTVHWKSPQADRSYAIRNCFNFMRGIEIVNAAIVAFEVEVRRRVREAV